MRVNMKVLSGLAIVLLFSGLKLSRANAAEAYPVFTDVNLEPQKFGATAGFFGGLFIPNDTATFNGDPVLSINQNGQLPCCHGALIEVSVSNGENGTDSTEGGANVDTPNMTAPNPVFAAIGNTTGRLENGNVIRFSAWFRSDPANPITLDPQVQPVLKIEYWKEALSGNADSEGVKAFPNYGDRVFDQDQQGNALAIPDLPQWVDINGDGIVNDAAATVGNGRVSQITTSEWRRVEVTHTVNSADWLGIGGEAFGANDLNAIESVKAVMFMGDFGMTNLTGDGADGGNLLIDNVLVEVFKEAASITPNMNPQPSPPVGLAGDYNSDGSVDAADYVAWRKNPSAFGGDPGGYNIWRANFGDASGLGSGIGGSSAVPEPASFMLAVVAAIILVSPMRRR